MADAVIRRSIQGMLEELEYNLWEAILVRLVDYGHTISPELEMAALRCVDYHLSRPCLMGLSPSLGLMHAHSSVQVCIVMLGSHQGLSLTAQAVWTSLPTDLAAQQSCGHHI